MNRLIYINRILFKETMVIVILFIAMILFPLATYAQNNPNNIDDLCYKYYTKSIKDERSKESLGLALKMAERAKIIKDKKAEIMAQGVIMDHYFYNKKNNEFDRERKVLMNLSKKYKMLNYYYFAWSRIITNMYAKGKYIEAISEVNKLKTNAFENDNSYGIVLCYKLLGNMMIILDYYNDAKNEFQNAIKYAESKGDYKTALSCYEPMCFCLMNTRESDKALEILLDDKLKSMQGRLYNNVYADLVIIYFEKRQFDKMTEAYENYLKGIREYGTSNTRESHTYEIQAIMNVYEGNIEEAIENANKTVSRNIILEKIYNYIGNYKEAYKYAQASKVKKQNPIAERSFNFISKINAEVENHNLIEQNNNLLNIKKQLEIVAQKKELQHLKQLQQINEANAEHKRILAVRANLELKNNELQANKEKEQLLLSKAKIEKQEEEIKQSLALTKLYTIAFSSFLILTIFALFRARRLKLSRNILDKEKMKLVEANRIIKKERDHAQQANIIKDEFVKNISHDIRTPLNSIVGFASLISTNRNSPSNSDIKEYADEIAKNSNILTEHINKILEMAKQTSEYEDKKYN